MLSEITTAINQVEESKKLWHAASVSLPNPDNLQGNGIAVSDLNSAFDEVILLLKAVNKVNKINQISWQVQKANIVNNANALLLFFQQNHTNPAAVSDNALAMCHWLWSLKVSALNILPLHDVSKFSSSASREELSKQIYLIEQLSFQADQIAKNIKIKDDQAAETLQKLEEIKGQSVTISTDLLSNKVIIEGYERESGTAKTNTEAAAAKATTESEKARQLVESLTEQTNKLKESVEISDEKQKLLFMEFDNRRNEISGLLENANKVGLASSFQLRRKSLQRTEWLWIVCFAIGIISLFCTGKSIIKDIATDSAVVEILIKILVTGPLIWFTWFAARQYGHTLRITEDYAFKEAAAMAYAGYRNEVGKDEKMLALLQESAIRAYSENPAKVLLNNNEPVSPFHEALEKILARANPKELAEIFNAFKKQ